MKRWLRLADTPLQTLGSVPQGNQKQINPDIVPRTTARLSVYMPVSKKRSRPYGKISSTVQTTRLRCRFSTPHRRNSARLTSAGTPDRTVWKPVYEICRVLILHRYAGSRLTARLPLGYKLYDGLDFYTAYGCFRNIRPIRSADIADMSSQFSKGCAEKPMNNNK